MEPRNEIMEMFMKKFDKFKKGNGPRSKTEVKCFNCEKPGHFTANYWQPKTEQLKAVENDDVKAIKPKELKALFAAESRGSLAECNSEDEEYTINCFLANNVEEDLDFGLERSSREVISAALNDMVIKCKRLAERLLEAQTDNRT